MVLNGEKDVSVCASTPLRLERRDLEEMEVNYCDGENLSPPTPNIY